MVFRPPRFSKPTRSEKKTGGTNCLAPPEKLNVLPTDLLLLDVQLGGEIDGILHAKKVVRIRQVPIVFVTSMRDDQTFERARQIQPVVFILKPFDTLQLQRAIELAVEGLAKAAGIQKTIWSTKV
ncbi:MAG TPA: hypothetical protein DCF33_08285 [Saprospirales bacterium]|nr:hypothetical protein [Saprospirales bacterium]